MKYLFLALGLLSFTARAQTAAPVASDWLVQPGPAKAHIDQSANGSDIVMSNGLVRRVFRLKPDLACIEYKNLTNGQQLLRAVKPEARVVLNGVAYNVGGLYGQKENAYLLPQWIDQLKVSDSAFHYVDFKISPITPYLQWKTAMWAGSKKNATGSEVAFRFGSSLPALAGMDVYVHYAIFDGIPLISKWVTIENKSKGDVTIDQVVNEILAVTEEESAVVGKPEEMAKPNGLYIENNFAFNNSMRYGLSDQATHWKVDKSYTSQVNYDYQTPCLLEVHPKVPVGTRLKAGEKLESIRTYELLMDSYDRERSPRDRVWHDDWRDDY